MKRHPRLLGIALSAVLVSTLTFWSLRPRPEPALTSTLAPAATPAPAPTRLVPEPVTPPPSAATATVNPTANARALPLSAPLLDWAARYLAAPASTRTALLAEGLSLARERRTLLAALIRTDPEAALAATVPRALRTQLPAEIVAELEQLVSARAELAVIQTCFHPPGTPHDHTDDLHRATVIDDREYRVHVYGSRLHDASLPATSLLGIAIDRDLAIYDSRLRVLEPGEPHPPSSAPYSTLAVEANGQVTLLPSPEALPAFAAALLASEQNPAIPTTVNEADSGLGSSTVTGRPTQAWTHGAKALLVIRVDFSDLVGTPINKFDGDAPITPAYIDNVLNGANGVRTFLQQSSYGKNDLLFNSATDVTAVLRLPNTASSYATADNNALLHTHARAAATTAGFNLSAYQRIAVVFTHLGDLAASKITYGGLANIIGANLWINGAFDLRVVAHELGHTHGLRHSNLWTTTDGNPVSITTGTSLEYGDPFDLMGDGDFFENDFSHWNKSLLQWLPDAAVTLASTSDTYRVHRFDNASANLSAPRALKIVRDSTRDYWIGYRRGTSSALADNGAYVLWGYNTASQGALLDFTTPRATPAEAGDAPLALNTPFTDTAAGITLRPLAQGGSGADEWLDVQVTLQPRLAWASTSYVANEQGGSITLTVTRSANSTGNVSVSYATSPGTATSPADFTSTSGSLAWADGDLTPKTITVPLVADALVEGTETFTVTLSSPVGGVIVEPAITTITLADPGSRDPSFASAFINSTINQVLVLPDGKLLVAGWFSQLQTPTGTSYNYGRIARLTSTGAIDPEFNPGTGANGTIHAIARQTDGKILVGGEFSSTATGITRDRIARLHPDGSLDTSFRVPSRPNNTVHAILPLPDGKLLVGGAFTQIDTQARTYIARLHSDGSLDTSFTGPSFFIDNGWRVECLALQPDGKILVGGAFYQSTGQLRASLRRLNPNGSEDTTFNGLTSGASDAFDPQYLGTLYSIAVRQDGRILIAGDFSQFNGAVRTGLALLTSTGALEPSFAPVLNNTVKTLLRLPDGRLLIGGDFTTLAGSAATRIALLSAGGTLDTAFAAAGGHASTVEDLALQPDGNVLLAGDYASYQGASPRPLWRLIPGLPALPGVLQFATDALTAIEGSTATLSVTRTGGSLGALAVGYSTVASSATAGTDYTTTTGTLTWADGEATAKTITIPTASDASADTPETLLVNLGAPLLGGALLADRQQATVTLATAFDSWRATHFTSAELSNSAVSGDTADPDGDGLNNLAEFALGRTPRTADAASAWTTAIQNIGGVDYLTITFRRRSPALDLAYAVQSSPTLANGSWSADALLVGTPTIHGDGTETVTYRDAVATSSASRRFLRVQVTRTP
jgi:uncharacterized delta-60 repeat protein